MSENAIAIHEQLPWADTLATMSDAEFEARLDALKQAQKRMERIQREVLEPEVDYGVVPGTGAKPTLLKPGSEKLCKFYHLVPTFDIESILGDGVTTPQIRVIAKCSLRLHSDDGPIVAQGVGAANSWEKKYRYREAVRRCPECGVAAIIKGKAEWGGGWVCWPKRGGCGAKFEENDPALAGQQVGQIENVDPFDVENTLYKMACKRSQIDATLRATATSGLFTQDLEDTEPPASDGEPQRQQHGEPQRQQQRPQPQPKPSPTPMQRPKPSAANPERQALMQEWGQLWNKATLDLKVKPTITVSTSAPIDELRDAVEKLRAEVEATRELRAREQQQGGKLLSATDG